MNLQNNIPAVEIIATAILPVSSGAGVDALAQVPTKVNSADDVAVAALPSVGGDRTDPLPMGWHEAKAESGSLVRI